MTDMGPDHLSPVTIDAEAQKLGELLRAGSEADLHFAANTLKGDLHFLKSQPDLGHQLIATVNQEAKDSGAQIRYEPSSADPTNNVFIVKGDETIAAGSLPSQ